MGFPGGSDGKASACNAGDPGSAFSGSALGHVAYLRSMDIGHHGACRGGLAWSSGLAWFGSLTIS